MECKVSGNLRHIQELQRNKRLVLPDSNNRLYSHAPKRGCGSGAEK